MANKRILWKHRQAMVERAAREETYLYLVKHQSGLGILWFDEHIDKYAAFEIGNIQPSNMQAIERRFWKDVDKLVDKVVREYSAHSEAEQKIILAEIKRQMEPATRAAATPSAVLSVDVASLPRPVVYGGDITLETELAECIEFMERMQLVSDGRWLDDQFAVLEGV